MKIIAFVNQKGGVGKTTLSLNLAALLAQEGKKVLIIDNDSQANITNTFFNEEFDNTIYNVILKGEDLNNVIHKTSIENLDVVVNSLASADINLLLSTEIAREMKLKNAVTKAKLDYDYVLIDCNPSLDLNMVNALVACDEVIIPIDCSAYSLTGLKNLVDFIEKIKVLNEDLNIKGFVLNNVDRRTHLYVDIKEVIDEICSLNDIESLGKKIKIVENVKNELGLNANMKLLFDKLIIELSEV